MDKFKSFKEYLNQNGKMQDKPIVDPAADTAPKPTRTPPDPQKKGLGWQVPDSSSKGGKPAPYTAPGTEPGPQKGEKGFADQGDKKLVYEPTTKKPNPDEWNKETTWPKSKTEQFIDTTKGMSLPKFAKQMIDSVKPGDDCPTIFASREGHFRPTAYEAIRYVAHLALTNEAVMESLIMEFVHTQGLGKLMEELFKHKESYEEAVTTIDSERFANTIREMTAPPASETESDDDEATDSGKKKVNKAAKARAAGSIKSEPMDMAGSGVMQSKFSKKH